MFYPNFNVTISSVNLNENPERVMGLQTFVCMFLLIFVLGLVDILLVSISYVELEKRCGWHTSVHQPLMAWKKESNILFKGKYGGAAGKQTLGKQNKKGKLQHPNLD